MRKVLLCAWLFVMLATVAMAYQVQPRKLRVYMFGFATSYVDSVSYMTDLQAVDAYIMPNGFLAYRSLYSLQLNNYLLAKRGRENMTCTVFFSKSKSKAEKKFQKVRKIFQKTHRGIIQPLGIDVFRFEPEEWTEFVPTEALPSDTINTPTKKK